MRLGNIIVSEYEIQCIDYNKIMTIFRAERDSIYMLSLQAVHVEKNRKQRMQKKRLK